MTFRYYFSYDVISLQETFYRNVHLETCIFLNCTTY